MEIKFPGKKGLNRRCEGDGEEAAEACSLLCVQEELTDEQLLVKPGFDSGHVKSGTVGRWKDWASGWVILTVPWGTLRCCQLPGFSLSDSILGVTESLSTYPR